jgi:putative transposase
MFAIKGALKLNNREATLMAKQAGLRLVVFNRGLSLRTQIYCRVKLSDSKVINELKKVLTDRVKKQGGFAWMNQLSSRVYQNALIDLKDAFNRYRSSLSGYPTFASGRDGQSFTVDSSNRKVVLNAGNTIKIPTVGTFQGHEPQECCLVSQTFTLSQEGRRWFVSFCVNAERLPVQQLQEFVGIDLGIKAFARMSNNQVFEAIKPLKQAKNKLAIQLQASKQVKCSNNQRQTYNKMTRIHSRISGIRKELLHKLTTPTVKSLKLIKIGKLNVKRMMANPKVGLAISDLGFYEFRRHQLEYKCKMYGATRVLVDRGFPSSLACSICGKKKDRPRWYQDL